MPSRASRLRRWAPLFVFFIFEDILKNMCLSGTNSLDGARIERRFCNFSSRVTGDIMVQNFALKSVGASGLSLLWLCLLICVDGVIEGLRPFQ